MRSARSSTYVPALFFFHVSVDQSLSFLCSSYHLRCSIQHGAVLFTTPTPSRRHQPLSRLPPPYSGTKPSASDYTPVLITAFAVFCAHSALLVLALCFYLFCTSFLCSARRPCSALPCFALLRFALLCSVLKQAHA